MPYFGPAPADGRPRLARSPYTVPHGGGAFGPLGTLPRRSKPAMFSLAQDDDDDAGDDSHQHRLPQLNPNNSLRISISHDANDTLLTHSAAVPFPRISPTSPGPTRCPSVTRSTSTPIMLSNGKPLKSSLKSSSSSPQIALPVASPTPHHPRTRSEPSSPHVDHRKNVHFPTNELATIRVFNRSAKPASVSRIGGGGDETETETEGELSTGSNSGFIRGSSAVVPFPKSLHGRRRYEIDPDVSSPIPTTLQPSTANVFLESLTFNTSLPSSPSSTAGISGTLLVRNIAYEKHVAVRFTLDDWQTTSEVSARHLTSLTTLPNTFVDCKKLTYGDIIALSPHSQTYHPTNTSSPSIPSLPPQWDRFTFQIKLDDYAHPSRGGLTKRTMWLVVRYTTGTGIEAWDNNLGKNYKIGFREQPLHPHSQHALDNSAVALMQKRNRVFAVSTPSSFASATLTTPPITTMQHQQHQEHTKSIAETTLTKLKKLNLRNYAAPSISSTVYTPTEATAKIHETLEFVNGFPAHLDVRSLENEKEVGIEADTEERLREEEVVRRRREEESDTESEESIGTPVHITPNAIALNKAGGIETGIRIRSRTPSPTEVHILTGPENGIDSVPLLTLSAPSLPEPSSLQPPTSSRGRQPILNNALLSGRSKTIDPHVLAMGTSPPFSMMSDFTTNSKPMFWSKETKHVEDDKVDDVQSREESIYWPWGGLSTEQIKPADDGEGEEVKKKRMVLLDGIREKSTNSPTGDVMRISSPIGRKSSPVQMSEGKKNLGTVSPQPRGKQDWSKVGSGWMIKSPSPRGSPSSTPPISPPPAVSSFESSTPTPKPSPSTITPSIPTPTEAPTLSNATTTTQSQQDSVYQAFVRQWCFAQGPSHPVVGSGTGLRYTTPGGGTGEYRYSVQRLPQRRRGEGKGGSSGVENSGRDGNSGSRGGDGPLAV